MKLRIAAENSPNMELAPWRGAIGIERADEDDLTVPSLMCWLTRGAGQREFAELICRLINSDDDGLVMSEPF
jgi:hypothetical protein